MKAHHIVLATLAATFILLLAGGTINPTGSSLACPDWPLCFGQVFPEMTNGVEFEHTHRIVASVVGVMTLLMGFALWTRRPKDNNLRRLGIVAVVTVGIQAVLGGLTVIYRLPPAISIGHLSLSMLFFLLLNYLALRTREPSSKTTASQPGAGLKWAAAISIAVYGQIVLGALVRHSKGGLACGTDMIRCAGQWWPHWLPGQIQMVHRYVAVFVVALLIVASPIIWKEAKRRGRRLAMLASATIPILAISQMVIGLLTVYSAVEWKVVTIHLGLGALLLAASAVSFFELRAKRIELRQPTVQNGKRTSERKVVRGPVEA